jgi:hypothetical protein
MPRRITSLVLSILLPAAAFFAVGAATTATPAAAYPLGEGYWLAARDGGMFSFGDAQFYGSTGDIRLNSPIVGMAGHPFLEGYWLVASDGGIFSFGSSGFYGSTGNLRLQAPIVGMASTPTGEGYWLVAADGGIFSFGDAEFLGSMGGTRLNKPIVGMAATPSGNGYWLVATDGGIFTFGDANFFGSTGNIALNKPIVGMASTPTGAGYYMVASDGGLFTFGDAVFRGSRGGAPLNSPVVGMAVSRSGAGYQLVATDGGIFNYGDSQFYGSTGDIRLNQPILGMALRPRLAVKVDGYGTSASQDSRWVNSGGDWRLSLKKEATGDAPAGARVFGVEGLDVGQLGTMSFALESGTCSGGPVFALTYDTNGDRKGDANATSSCAGGAGTKSWDPVAAGVPTGADVVSLDITYGAAGSTVEIDDIKVAGLTVTDFNTFRAA